MAISEQTQTSTDISLGSILSLIKSGQTVRIIDSGTGRVRVHHYNPKCSTHQAYSIHPVSYLYPEFVLSDSGDTAELRIVIAADTGREARAEQPITLFDMYRLYPGNIRAVDGNGKILIDSWRDNCPDGRINERIRKLKITGNICSVPVIVQNPNTPPYVQAVISVGIDAGDFASAVGK